MDENTREIEREIAASRARLGERLRELESRFTSLTDWRWHYRRHTGAALAVGVCGGLIFESLTHRRRPTAERIRDASTRGRARLAAAPRKGSRIGNIFEKLVVMASTRAFNMAADRFVAGLKSSVRPAPARPPAWYPGTAARQEQRPPAAVRGA